MCLIFQNARNTVDTSLRAPYLPQDNAIFDDSKKDPASSFRSLDAFLSHQKRRSQTGVKHVSWIRKISVKLVK